jgi:two-component system, OmpR family, sensor kinase
MLSSFSNRLQMQRYILQLRGPYRELMIRGPRKSTICVGKRVEQEAVQLQRRDLGLVATGCSILGLGLLGSYLVSRRTVSPIRTMSQTAASIGPESLDERMDLTKLDLELEQLGAVLNSMLDRLDVSFQQQQRFVADASHELRTPLTVMLSTLEFALARERPAEEYRDHLAACQRSAIRMRELIESLLFLARLDSDSQPVGMQRCNFATIVREQVTDLAELAKRRQIRVDMTLEPTEVDGNSQQLERLVSNIVVNAIEYNQPNGSVQIDLTCSDMGTILKVADTGVGILSTDCDRIFDRFFRVDSDRSRRTGGTGLGLAICKSIVDRHGGSIQVDSTVGTGTTMKITLPARLQT